MVASAPLAAASSSASSGPPPQNKNESRDASTQGDANSAADPYVAYPDEDRVWVVKATVPFLGTAIRALQGPVAHQVLVLGLPGLTLGHLVFGAVSLGLIGYLALAGFRPR